MGGSDPYGQKGLKNCDVFDPVTKAWTSCAPLNIRKFVAGVGRKGQLQNYTKAQTLGVAVAGG